MARGDIEPISEIEIGDEVLATDPMTGEQGARRVTDTITGDGIKHLVDVTVDGHTVTATDKHPFWVDDQGRWVDAKDLRVGDDLLMPDGTTADVDNIAVRTETRRVHNLTVEGIHTYYVVAGDEPLLVHNCADPAAAALAKTDPSAIKPYSALRKQTAGSGMEAHHLVEKRFAQTLGVKPGEMLSLPMSRGGHQAVTNAWRQAIPYGAGTRAATPAMIQDAARRIYSSQPAVLNALGL